MRKNAEFPWLAEDAPDVPPGLRPRIHVTHGCGSAKCSLCYVPKTTPTTKNSVRTIDDLIVALEQGWEHAKDQAWSVYSILADDAGLSLLNSLRLARDGRDDARGCAPAITEVQARREAASPGAPC